VQVSFTEQIVALHLNLHQNFMQETCAGFLYMFVERVRGIMCVSRLTHCSEHWMSTSVRSAYRAYACCWLQLGAIF